MELWTLSRQAARAAEFIRYWSEAYEYEDEDTYASNIGKPLTERRLMDLFRWKNGGEISARKKESIVRNYLPHVRGAKAEDDVWALTYKGASHGPIWNIFFAHCLMPDRFPIYDQHVHRAMMYLCTGKASELPKGKRAVIDCYRERYVDFLRSFVGSAPRSVDRALWAFGRFIKANPWATAKNVRDTSPETIATFDADRIERLRRRARSATKVPDRGPEGWTKSTADPMKLFGVFRPLRLKDGFALRAYQYRSGGGNGHGLVFAMPDGTPFPAPEECRPEPPEYPEDYEPVPFPAEAERDAMRLVEGDGEPWSYILASFLARELQEIGAIWHACIWSTHTILGENPLVSGRKGGALPPDGGPHGDAKDWVWVESKPRHWKPTVLKESGRVVVRFYTYSGHDREAIYRHVDSYEPGCYAFETERAVIAEGQGGFVF